MLQISQIQRTPRYFDLLADYSEVDYRRLIDMVTWIEKSPSSNLYPRQLPVAGLDSKWLGGRKTVLADIFGAMQGKFSSDGDFS
jgi:hypothetical protein